MTGLMKGREVLGESNIKNISIDFLDKMAENSYFKRSLVWLIEFLEIKKLK